MAADLKWTGYAETKEIIELGRAVAESDPSKCIVRLNRQFLDWRRQSMFGLKGTDSHPRMLIFVQRLTISSKDNEPDRSYPLPRFYDGSCMASCEWVRLGPGRWPGCDQERVGVLRARLLAELGVGSVEEFRLRRAVARGRTWPST